MKLGADAFDYYASLGAERSFERVARRYKVDKRTVTRRAKDEDWSGRLAAIETKAREASDKKIEDALVEMRERHLKTLKAVSLRAVEALQRYPLNSAMEATRAAEIAIRLERLIAGESTERAEVSVEEIYRQETRRWLTHDRDG